MSLFLVFVRFLTPGVERRLKVNNVTVACGNGSGDFCMDPSQFVARSPRVAYGKFIGVGVIANNHTDMMVIIDIELGKN